MKPTKRGIYCEFISEEERLNLCIREAELQGHTFPSKDWSAVIAHFYEKDGWHDERFFLRDLGNGRGIHCYRPFYITEQELDFILERRARKAKEAIDSQREKVKS